MKKTGLEQSGWGLLKNMAVMGGYAAFCLFVFNILRAIHRGDLYYIPEHIEYPEIVLIILICIPIVLSILATFAKVPVWIWVEKIRERLRKEGKNENKNT